MFDVIIIGAGPAGSSCATMLGNSGFKVQVFEKAQFPRYQIGESLIPFCYPSLKKLNLIDQLNEGPYVKKYSVQFAGMSGNISQPFYFESHIDGPISQTWQVNRSDFDEMLMKNAMAAGASYSMGSEVKDYILDGEKIIGVQVEENGRLSSHYAKWVVDASGRNTFSSQKFKWKKFDPNLRKMAIWTYFKKAKRDPGKDEGATTVAYLPEKSWFWYIPLANDMVSVGIVGESSFLYQETKDPEKIFNHCIELNKWIKDHLEGAQRCRDFQVTGEFTYRNEHCGTHGLSLVGDAFSFLDPVFSSGVYLALHSGTLMGELLALFLKSEITIEKLFDQYFDSVQSAIEAMRKLVYSFYEENFNFRELIEKAPHVKGLLTDCLIGNVFVDLDPLFKAIEKLNPLPQPISFGRAKL